MAAAASAAVVVVVVVVVVVAVVVVVVVVVVAQNHRKDLVPLGCGTQALKALDPSQTRGENADSAQTLGHTDAGEIKAGHQSSEKLPRASPMCIM